MRTTITAWLDAHADIEVEPPYRYVGDDQREHRVPWVVRLDRATLSMHIDDRETLTRLRDALTAALDENPEAT